MLNPIMTGRLKDGPVSTSSSDTTGVDGTVGDGVGGSVTRSIESIDDMEWIDWK